MAKIRLDTYLTEHSLAPSREKAKAYIMSGIVYVDNQKADKAGYIVPQDALVEVRGKTMPYVSRGGYKLEKAIDCFAINLTDKVCMDVGASTGGFTDCMLMRGAKKVYSIDVGYGQLAWKLRSDPRVVNLERTNVRYLTDEQISEKVDFISVDVSFISLKLILPVIKGFLTENGHIMCLIKPQFEAGREKVGKKGVVRDIQVHIEVIETIYQFCINNALSPIGLSYSPIKGPEGNIEYLLFLSNLSQSPFSVETIYEVADESHSYLSEKGQML